MLKQVRSSREKQQKQRSQEVALNLGPQGPLYGPHKRPKPGHPGLAQRPPKTKGLHARVHRSHRALAGPPDRQDGFVTLGHEGAPEEILRA